MPYLFGLGEYLDDNIFFQPMEQDTRLWPAQTLPAVLRCPCPSSSVPAVRGLGQADNGGVWWPFPGVPFWPVVGIVGGLLLWKAIGAGQRARKAVAERREQVRRRRAKIRAAQAKLEEAKAEPGLVF